MVDVHEGVAAYPIILDQSLEYDLLVGVDGCTPVRAETGQELQYRKAAVLGLVQYALDHHPQEVDRTFSVRSHVCMTLLILGDAYLVHRVEYGKIVTEQHR